MKKSQARMIETIAVLFIFFILIGLGMVFYIKYSRISLKEKEEKIIQEMAQDIARKTLHLPELVCSSGEAEPEGFCFDLMKLRHANKTFSNHFADYYFDLFPYVYLKVVQVYPEYQEWLLYNKSKPKMNSKHLNYFVVVLKDEKRNFENKGKYSFGFLEVGVYS